MVGTTMAISRITNICHDGSIPMDMQVGLDMQVG